MRDKIGVSYEYAINEDAPDGGWFWFINEGPYEGLGQGPYETVSEATASFADHSKEFASEAA